MYAKPIRDFIRQTPWPVARKTKWMHAACRSQEPLATCCRLLQTVSDSLSGVSRRTRPCAPFDLRSMTSRKILPPEQRRCLLTASICFSILVLPGVPALASDVSSLRQRVEAYWSARRESDLAAAYELYSPDFRKKYTRGQFLASFQRLLKFPPLRFEVTEVSIADSGTAARVKVTLVTRHDLGPEALEIQSIADEEWVLEDSKWWKRDESIVPSV